MPNLSTCTTVSLPGWLAPVRWVGVEAGQLASVQWLGGTGLLASVQWVGGGWTAGFCAVGRLDG